MAEAKRRIERFDRKGYTELTEGNLARSAAPAVKKQDPELKKRYLRNRERSRNMNMTYVVFLTIAAVLCVSSCIIFLKLQTESTSLQKKAAALQIELKSMQMENDTVYNEIIASIDLEKVKNIAMNRFGMAYPREDQIVHYESVSRDYVRQYLEIPDEAA